MSMLAVFFNLKPLSDQNRNELLDGAMQMLEREVLQSSICSNNTFAEIKSVPREFVRSFNPYIWEKFPGSWFMAYVTTSEVELHPVTFVIWEKAKDEDQSEEASLKDHLNIITMN